MQMIPNNCITELLWMQMMYADDTKQLYHTVAMNANNVCRWYQTIVSYSCYECRWCIQMIPNSYHVGISSNYLKLPATAHVNGWCFCKQIPLRHGSYFFIQDNRKKYRLADLVIDTSNFDQMKSIKILGLFIDEKSNWQNHWQNF